MFAGDVIELVPGVVTRADVHSMPAQGTIKVTLPLVQDKPQFCVPAAIQLGDCGDLLVQPGCQSGAGGHDLIFEYVAAPNIPGGRDRFKAVKEQKGTLT